MDTRDSNAQSRAITPLDPLRRVFVHNGKQFRTHDGVYYERRGLTDTIHRHIPKVRGKKARADDRVHRRLLRRAAQKTS